MQSVVNESLARNRVRLASGFHIAALAVFAVGLAFSWQQTEFDQIIVSYAAIIVGLVLYQLGQMSLRRWGPRFRQDAALAKALKGLDNRHTLLSFASSKLPDYLLVGPNGVRVIVPRMQDGEIVCRADRWHRESRGLISRVLSLFGGNPLGDPTRDAIGGAQKVRHRLESRELTGNRAPDVRSVIVFTHPSAKLRLDGCSVPAARLKQLRGAVAAGGKGTLDPRTVGQVVQALRE